MAKVKGDKDLYQRMRDSGVRKRVAKELSELPVIGSQGKRAPKAARDAVERLEGVLAELKEHAGRGDRKVAARKAARTRDENATKRSNAAKRGARKRAGTAKASGKAKASTTARSTAKRSTSKATPKRGTAKTSTTARSTAKRSTSKATPKRSTAKRGTTKR